MSQRTAGTETRNYTYDSASRLATAATSTQTLSFGYDNRGLLASSTDASGNTTYGYDAAQRLTARTAPGAATTSYGYDTLGRLATVRGGINLNYSYTNGSQISVKSAVSPTTGYESRSYDANRRPTSYLGSNAYKIAATYTADGQTASLEQSESGNAASNSTSYNYDDAGRLTTSTVSQNNAVVSTTSYGWDADGNRTSLRSSAELVSGLRRSS
ncbi:hypothetical protein [Kribbella sp. NPDC048928]|uniref:hypothetical protein n=1 Tax=Kribbella sp. NPDC048928 TaxID=3364111 RepID=UPI00371C0EE8